MATSPVNTLDKHDWMRVFEMIIQGMIAVGGADLLQYIPLMHWGRFQAIEPIVLLVLTEIVKRYKQQADSVSITPAV